MLFLPMLRRRARVLRLMGLLTMALADSHAQTQDVQPSVAGGVTKGVVSIVPRLTVAETFTDNVRLTDNGRRVEQITEISPGVRITSNGRRVKAYFDYALRELFYAQKTMPRTTLNALNTFGTVEAVEKSAFIDFSGNISQQAISAFGAQSVGNSATNANLAETSSYRLSPHVRGRLTDVAEYEARYSVATTRSKSALVPDVLTTDAQVKLGSGRSLRRLGWSLEATRQNIDFRAGRTTQADRLKATLMWAASPQLRLSVLGGPEANNYMTAEKERHTTTGFGVDWNPTERTRLSALGENRFFGEGHRLSFEHRTPRTAWRFNDIRDVFATPSQAGMGRIGSVYDLYYQQFSSIEPDPILRAQLVNNFLQANGISPTSAVLSNYLTSAVTLQRRQDVSVALLGARDTVTFMASQSEGSRLDSLSTLTDDFSNSTLIRQRGFSLSYAHRLTPQTALNILGSQQNTWGSTVLYDNRLRSLNVSVSTKVGQRSTATLAARRVVFNSAAFPYVENAITGTLHIQF